MNITKVTILKLNWPNLAPAWHPLVVKVTTDNGLVGYGEAATSFGVGYQGTIGILKELIPHYLGKNPLNISELWNDAYNHTFWAQGSGVIFFSAIGALDIALWDIKGQYEGKSIAQLLNSKSKTYLKAYASQVQHGWSRYKQAKFYDVSDLQQATLTAIKDGYDTVKVEALFPNEITSDHQIQEYFDKLAAIREVSGEKVRIIVECHSKLPLRLAILLCKKLTELNISYIEET